MSDNKDQKIKKQRDLFLAFAFASADLFIEASDTGKVIFTLGASKGMTGFGEEDLMGKKWLDLFSAYDQAQLIELYEKAKPGKRCGPVLVDLDENISRRKAVLTGIKMPGSDGFYITLGLSNKLMSKLAASPPAHHGDLASVSDFKDDADEIFDFGQSMGIDPEMTLFDFGFTQEIIEEFDDEAFGKFQEELASFLQSNSFNNVNPCKIDDNKYLLPHDPDLDIESFKAELGQIAKKHAPDGTTGYIPEDLTVVADLDKVGDWGAEKALAYMLTGFEATDDIKDLEFSEFSETLRKLATEQKDKVDELKSIIDRVDFGLHFLPIMTLEDQTPIYYEIVPHFHTGNREEWMMIAEDSGLMPSFNISFCERVVNHINFKSGGSRTKFSMSISATCIENQQFLEKIKEQLLKGQNLPERLHFEISHPAQIKDMGKAAKFIKMLRDLGFDVTLDNCNADSTALDLVTTLSADNIKINRKYTKRLLKDKRTQMAYTQVSKECKEANITIYARGIKTQEQLEFLISIGIQYGQGELFGGAQESPNFIPPQK